MARKNYIGQKFNHLTIIKDTEDRFTSSGARKRRVWCECDCGNSELICLDLANVVKGNTKGCKKCRKTRESELHKLKFNKYEVIGEDVYVYHDTIPDFYTVIDLKWLDYFKSYHLGCTPNIPSDSYWYIMQNGNKIKIHQIIGGKRCDHIDGDKNNNKESNLRKATQQQNNLNRPHNKENKTGYKGVTTLGYVANKKYRARIEYNEKVYNLGSYYSPEEAARAYDKKAIELFGEYAWTNFPVEDYE